jgi:hypothetical protein
MSLEEEIALEALGLAIPAVGRWLRTRIEGGSDAAQAAADIEALFASADTTIDVAEDIKFGPETKP